MCQATSIDPQTVCNDWSHVLPGVALTHTVHVVSQLNPQIVSAAAAVLEGETIVADRWNVSRCGGVLEQRIALGEMPEGQAIRLRQRLAALDGVLRTRLEHHFIRGVAATS